MIIILINIALGVATFKVFQIWGLKSLKSWGAALGIILVFLLLNYSGSGSSYYQEGYSHGYEAGKYDASTGRAVQSEADKVNTAGIKFIQRYGSISSGEMHDAEKEYRNGYSEGYDEGFRDGR